MPPRPIRSTRSRPCCGCRLPDHRQVTGAGCNTTKSRSSAPACPGPPFTFPLHPLALRPKSGRSHLRSACPVPSCGPPVRSFLRSARPILPAVRLSDPSCGPNSSRRRPRSRRAARMTTPDCPPPNSDRRGDRTAGPICGPPVRSFLRPVRPVLRAVRPSGPSCGPNSSGSRPRTRRAARMTTPGLPSAEFGPQVSPAAGVTLPPQGLSGYPGPSPGRTSDQAAWRRRLVRSMAPAC